LAGVVLFAQDDDPFATGGDNDPFADSPSSNDPFEDTTPQPPATPDTPTTTPDANDPFATDTPTSDNDPFATDTSANDPFGDEGADNDPFGGGNASGGGFPTGMAASGGSLGDRMSDTLIQPLRDEFPWKKRAMEERQTLASYSIRESDVFWAKTVWREIDINEKMNHPFAYPQAPFLTLMLDAINKNDIQLYKYDPFTDGEFQDSTTWAEVQETLGSVETVQEAYRDSNGDVQYRDREVVNKFNVGSVQKFRIKEVWYFDKKHSRMRVEIMGIAPLRTKTLADLGITDPLLVGAGGGATEPMFWVYYPDLRRHMARYETFNPLNDALRMSWDDLLTNRFFASYIVKASNPLDQYVADMTSSSLDALYEGEKIKEEIFNFEHDLWSY